MSTHVEPAAELFLPVTPLPQKEPLIEKRPADLEAYAESLLARHRPTDPRMFLPDAHVPIPKGLEEEEAKFKESTALLFERIRKAREEADQQKKEIASRLESFDRSLEALNQAQIKLQETGKEVDEKHAKIRALLSAVAPFEK
eukprot:TRINITY_DN689_c0_g1_i1.p2 TRINITY_DN689_c0_g1~~TRINITY_DN689_c0_g1_i1.p2  ORF type:complete len:143 (+),score=59.42 TRINITY_DN689_c0_g1_i1:163-591(+)